MKKKATLLIKNIAKIYTMQENEASMIKQHCGYIAIHHDFILEVGNATYHHLIDKDTRIIDAHGMLAIPGFIECHGCFPSASTFDMARIQSAYFTLAAQKGVLTIAFLDEIKDRIPHLFCEGIYTQQDPTYPLYNVKEMLRKQLHFQDEQFCISSYDKQYQDSDMLLMARLITLYEGSDALQLLKAMTLYPAARLGLGQVGKIVKGMQADILLCKGEDIKDVFQSFQDHSIAHVIKKGVRIFPNVLI